jgi:hypothetical protein
MVLFFIGLIIGLVPGFLIGKALPISLDNSQIFNNLAIGVGALVGSVGVFKIMSDYVSLRKKQRAIQKYQRLYPREKIDKDFKIVNSPITRGKFYILNCNTLKRHWIESSQTFLELDFFWDDTKEITEDEFNEYSEGPGILTSGVPGS